MSEAIHRTNPPINAMDFGVPPLFAERAENYARWAAAAEREACAKVCEEVERKATKQPPMVGQGCQACAAAIRARKP